MAVQRWTPEDAAFQLAEIVADARAGVDPYERVMDLFGAVAQASAAILTRWDEECGRARVVAVRGYSDEIVEHLVSEEFAERDEGYRCLRRDSGRPLRCWWDLDFDYARSKTARELLIPQGFRGGVSLRLLSRTGTYLGDFHLSTEARQFPSPEAMQVLHRSRMIIAALHERTALPGGDDVLPGAEHVVLIRPDGSVRPLTGAAAQVGYGELIERVRPQVGGADGGFRWMDRGGNWHHVLLRAVRGGTLVAACPAELPHGLSPRELQVLGQLGLGLSNAQIARRMRLSERTVAHYVERILRKLQVASRTEAASVAEREGLKLLETG
ncbi:response regulator transcription factor [Pseudonocardia hispaniensis]|uniref:Response regulator transcription factor n=1 Tax=Pseudonocardia hispaniensis TaxID=904933 RepID=A0ABW1J6V1_9PSEU